MPPSPPPVERLALSIAEVSAALGISARQVRRWIVTGRLPAVRLGRVWRVRRETLDAVLHGEIVIRSLPNERDV